MSQTMLKVPFSYRIMCSLCLWFYINFGPCHGKFSTIYPAELLFLIFLAMFQYPGEFHIVKIAFFDWGFSEHFINLKQILTATLCIC